MIWRRRFEVVVVGESGSAISQRSVISEHRSERDAREAAGQERRRLEVIRAEEAAGWVVMVLRGDEVLHEERPFDGRRDAAPVPPVESLGLTQRAPEPPGEPEPADESPAAEPAVPDPTAAAVTGGPDDDRPPSLEDRDQPTGAIPAILDEPVPTVPTADVVAPEAPSLPADAADPAIDAEPAAAGAPATEMETAAEGESATDLTPPVDRERPRGSAPASHPDDARWEIEPFAVEQVRHSPPPERTADDAADREPLRRRDDDIPSGRVPDDIIRRFEEAIARERTRESQRGSRPSSR